jgi:hypothetical protein
VPTTMTPTRARPRAPASQRGQALLAILVVLGMGFGALIYTLIRPAATSLESDRITNAALAQARDALIGYAAGDDNRPGSLPCPDTDNNGSAQLYSGSYCPSEIGRLPWRTLGLPDLSDGSGERLWYAVSRDYSRNPSGAPALNSDVPGQLTITGTAPAPNVIAIVFAPSAVVGNQVRKKGTAEENLVQNYLEGGNEVASATTFVSGTVSAAFNDRLYAITRDALLGPVEMRVAREARAVLRAFFSANGYFPFANSYSDATYRCTLNQYSGRIPRFFADDCKVAPADPDWSGVGVAWPPWFFANNWHQIAFYAIASRCAQPSTPGCAAAGSLMTVNGLPTPNDNLQALVIMPGRALGAQVRPCAIETDCLEDAENTNGDFVYVKSGVNATANDRLVAVSP